MKEIQKLITDIVEGSGVFLEDIRMSETGGTIKIVCDTVEGISSAELVAISRKILEDQEYDEKYAVNYRLEVSSPGVDAPLTLPRHFIKNKGREIELHHHCEEYPDPLKGTISEADEKFLWLSIRKNKEQSTLQIPMDKVGKAVVRLKW